ncbi:Protein of unknown function [Pyronema omphalodes CBS 100304]|uniref:Uncharacterized protein n=1 Tax=Pyronema omphalodes (strain CBS 100304) TaxID=1076935 RepID=U4LUF9_PYROM|nr:Protein of unknown function [Pyronema omphalodes CBS 100304]
MRLTRSKPISKTISDWHINGAVFKS